MTMRQLRNAYTDRGRPICRISLAPTPPPNPQSPPPASRGAHPLHCIEPDRSHLVTCHVAQLDEAACTGAEREAPQQHPFAGARRLIDTDFLRAIAVLDEVARTAGV